MLGHMIGLEKLQVLGTAANIFQMYFFCEMRTAICSWYFFCEMRTAICSSYFLEWRWELSSKYATHVSTNEKLQVVAAAEIWQYWDKFKLF